MDIERNQKESRNITFSDEFVNLVRSEAIASGLVYLIPSHKMSYYENGFDQITVGPARKYYEPYLLEANGDSVAVDMERIVPKIVSRAEIGLGSDSAEETKNDIIQLTNLAQTLLADAGIRAGIGKLLSQEDRENLEFDSFDTTNNYLKTGTLIRADLLLKEDGSLLCCDPNLVPLGYAICADISARVQDKTGLPVGPENNYIESLIKASQDKDRISGILTALNYPNWLSHMRTAQLVRDKGGYNFFVLPDFTLKDNGTLDFEKLNEFNSLHGVQSVNTKSDTPLTIIRHIREFKTFSKETNVINAAGIRMIESQLWMGLIMLPGFDEIAGGHGFDKETMDNIRKSFVPTLLIRRSAGVIEVATRASTDDGVLTLNWEAIKERQEILVAALWTNKVLSSKESEKDLAWYVKSPSTSGKKGVRFTSDGRIAKTEQNVLKVFDKMEIPDSSLMLLQPKVRSTMSHEEEMRVKIDMFIDTGSQREVLSTYMATPINQRSAHGSSSTRLGLVLKD